ncbi:MAG: autotransporter domain-containing protein [Endomicrobia bacterium]|nr:autotransporter domain-containing protein [Endomicrobiia bacterium]
MKLKKAVLLLPLFIFVFASSAYCAVNENDLKSAWNSQGDTGGKSYELTNDVDYSVSGMPAAVEEDERVRTGWFGTWTWQYGPDNFKFSVKSASYTAVFVSTAPHPIIPWLEIDVYEYLPNSDRLAINADKQSAAFTFLTKYIQSRGVLIEHSFEYLTITNGRVLSTNASVKGGGAYGNYYYNYPAYDIYNSTFSYYMTNRTIEFKDVYLISNTVEGINAATRANLYGGAVFIGGYSGTSGISAPSINVTFSSGTLFRGNSSDGYGGAYASLYNGVNTVFQGSTGTTSLFENNKAGKDGGAVYFKGGAGSLIAFRNSSVFNSNTAGGSGGAVYYERTAGTNAIVFSTAQFTNNKSGGYGGAVYSNTSVTFNDKADFSSNTATLGGGAIYSASGNLTFSNNSATTFNNNSTSNDLDAHGGAIYKGSTSPMSFAGIYFTSNTAGGSGGAVYSAGGNITFSSNAYITSNTAKSGRGGAIYSGSGAMAFSGAAEIIGNVSGTEGGAIYKGGVSSNLTFSGFANIQNNKAGGSGGAIYNAAGNIAFSSNTNISGNFAYGQGGAIYSAAGNITFSSYANITGNSADGINGHGGAVYSATGTLRFQSGAEFKKNESLLGSGGAVYKISFSAGDSITFDKTVTFSSNTASLGGGAIYSVGKGSARGTAVFAENAYFYGNTSENFISGFGSGGAIYADRMSYSFAGSAVFNNNSTALTRGGAIFAQDSVFNFSNAASFHANTVTGNAPEGGAAIHSVDSNFTFNASADFTENKTLGLTDVSGGALYALRSTNTFTGAVNFTGNVATAMGGGAAFVNSKAVFSGNAVFDGNSAFNGGALYLGGTSNALEFNGGAVFKNNVSSDNVRGGGAVIMTALEGNHKVDFIAGKTASFANNKSEANGGAFAVYSSAKNSVNFNGEAQFSSNTASANGGAFYSFVYGDDGEGEYKFTSGYFRNNKAAISGGAIYAFGNNVFDINSNIEFSGNKALGMDANGGGAIYSYNSTFIIDGSAQAKFQNNSASSRGGAVYQDSGLFDLKLEAEFTSNSADFSGGAVYASSGVMNFKNVLFENNTASGDLITSGGGAVYAFAQALNFLSVSKFENNKAQGITNGSGGAIYSSEGTLVFKDNSEFINNQSRFRGGALYQEGGISVFEKEVSFTGNSSEAEGGAVYLTGKGQLKFTDVEFKSNSAGTDGGAVYLKGSNASELAEIYFNQTASDLTMFDGNTANGSANSIHFAGNAGAQFDVSASLTVNINDAITASGINNILTAQGGGNFYMNDDIRGYEALNLDLKGVSFYIADGKNMSLNDLSVSNGSVLNVQTASAKTISVGGDFALASGTELNLGVFSSGGCDIINVDGSALLEGTINVTAGVGTYDNLWFTLVNAEGGYGVMDYADYVDNFTSFDSSGVEKFNPNPAKDLKYTFEFDANKKQFMLVVNGIRQSNFSGLDGLGKNQQNVAKMYDALSANASRPLANLIDTINDMSVLDQKIAHLETAPYFIANALNYSLHNRSKRDLFSHMEDNGKIHNIWAYADGGGSLVFQSDINSPGDFESSNYGGVFGADTKISPDFTLGFFGTYNMTDISQGRNEGNITSYGGGAYALTNRSAWQFKAALGYEGHSYDITRSVEVVGGSGIRQAKTEFRSYLLEADVEASYNMPVSGIFSLSPYAGLNGSWAHYQDFYETGANVLSLEIEGSNTFVTNARLGLSANMKMSKLHLSLSAEYDRLFSGYLPELDVKLNGQTEVFKVVGSETGQDIFGVNLYASYQLSESFKAYASGTMKTADNLSSLGGLLGVKYSF